MNIQNKLDPQLVLHRIHDLISRHEIERKLALAQTGEKQEVIESLLARQHQNDIHKALTHLHYADIADLLEGLPLEERLFIWNMVNSDIDGRVLLEVSPSVRESLLTHLKHDELIAISTQLTSDELADITPYLKPEDVHEIINALDEQARREYENAHLYLDSQIGSVMDFDFLKVRGDVSCKVVFRYLRRFEELPEHADKIFVVDEYNTLLGVLPIRKLLTSNTRDMVRDLMNPDVFTFHPTDDLEEAANAFERYDLITAPVLDNKHRLIGRITINEMVNVMRHAGAEDMLSLAGVSIMEELFSPVWQAFKSRCLWLMINLCTAFIASRVIGAFEESISKIVALAALMPIVAGIGGNAGNQTITMLVRAMGQQQFSWQQIRRLLIKELSIAMINGILWGSTLAVITTLLYHNAMLGFVMLMAMTLNLLLAAFMGVMIPAVMQKLNRDPALGSSVLITACTDSGGFFIFLGLASLMLL